MRDQLGGCHTNDKTNKICDEVIVDVFEEAAGAG